MNNRIGLRRILIAGAMIAGSAILLASPGVASEAPSKGAGVSSAKPGTPPGYRPKVGYFRHKNGVITITNRPEKYQQRDDYEVIDIKYEPIQVPKEYRKLDSATKYSANDLSSLVTRYSRRYGVTSNLVYAIIKIESNFDPFAQSTKGACGLMQLMPSTAEDMGVTSIFDPAQNIAGGTQYLSKLLKLFNNDIELALAGYNAGPSAVREANGIPPFKETQDYVRDVIACARQFAKEGVGATYLAQAYQPSQPRPHIVAGPVSRPARKCYTIHFNSGLTQPADEITDRDPYYCVKFGNRVDLIRKEHVAKIEEPA